MSVIRVFSDACNVRLSKCKDIIDYTSEYQIVFDKLLSLLNEDLWKSKKTIEMTLQGSLFQHLGKDYLALVLVIKTVWMEETTDLADTILRVIKHAEMNKRNDLNNAKVKILTVGIHRAPQKTCKTKECIERGVTIHYTNRC